MIVILMGAPGAGKGTQAEHLKKDKGFLKISTGDLLRREIAAKTELGKRVEDIMSRGALVSDEILLQVMKKELDLSHGRNLVLDGFPRTVPQAEWLSSVAKISGVIHIDADREELTSRIAGRLVCTACEAVFHISRKPPKIANQCDKCGGALTTREDDSRERVLHRLDVYHRQTEPVLEFYRENALYFRIDGNGVESSVSGQIDMLLEKIGR